MPTLQADKLKSTIAGIVRLTGSTAEEADIVADHLVMANLSGHDSHGVGMIPKYIDCFHRGLVVPNTAVTCVNDAGAILQYDAKKGFGQRVAKEATAGAIARAKETGVALYTLANAFHIGRVGSYGEQSIAEGMVSIHFVNVADHRPSVAPFGGGEARFIPNPVCIAVPGAGKQDPIVLDMATSKLALGKVRVAYNKRVQMEEGNLLDPDGVPTTDPGVMFPELRGALLPFGEHKGSGLALMCELLGGMMSGGQTIQPARERMDGIINNMLGIVFDPNKLISSDTFSRELQATIDYVKSAKPQDPAKPVLVAGDPERVARAKRGKEGIPLDDNTWTGILEAGESLGQKREETERQVA